MKSFLSQSISLQLWLVIVFAIVLLAITGVLVWVVISIRDIKHPKFGFGGKPLVAVAIALFLITLPMAVLTVKQRIDIIQKASQMNELSVVWFETSDRIDSSDVAFSATPIFQGKPWGDKHFDIEWMITGQQFVTFEEEDRSSSHPSYFVINLKKGTYDVTVRATSEDIDVSKTLKITID